MKAIGNSYRQVIAEGGHQVDDSVKHEVGRPASKPSEDGRLGKRLAYQDDDDDDFIDDDENEKPRG